MRNARIVVAIMLLAGVAIAQDVPREATAIQTQDLLTTAQADRSLAMFVSAVQSSGMAKMLREEGPFTVFALSNRAFASLTKEDRETLLTDRAAMHLLMAHYITRGVIPANDTGSLQSARTLVGVKLHIDIRSEGSYVNGAKLSHEDILCANGVIHVLDSFDPGLVRQAVAMARTSRSEK
jgi:transforming growth factor-beta-induced protein